MANLQKSTWRLLKTEPASGAWNMAVDEAILETASRSETPPTLRIYAWDPPCLSLGFAQPIEDVDLEKLESKSWDIVRRPTGGRAILHTDELTYSVAGPDNEPRLKGDILSSYRRISTALLAALEMLAVPVQALPKRNTQSEPNVEPVCFEVPTNYEITADDKKLVGSAQARRGDGVLQHGSLPLTGDLSRITQILAYPSEEDRQNAKTRLLANATTMTEVLGIEVTWEEAAAALENGFEQALNLNLEEGELTSAEVERALELERDKYGMTKWTQ